VVEAISEGLQIPRPPRWAGRANNDLSTSLGGWELNEVENDDELTVLKEEKTQQFQGWYEGKNPFG